MYTPKAMKLVHEWSFKIPYPFFFFCDGSAALESKARWEMPNLGAFFPSIVLQTLIIELVGWVYQRDLGIFLDDIRFLKLCYRILINFRTAGRMLSSNCLRNCHCHFIVQRNTQEYFFGIFQITFLFPCCQTSPRQRSTSSSDGHALSSRSETLPKLEN